MSHGKLSGQRSPGKKSSRCKDLEGGMSLADCGNRQEREEAPGTTGLPKALWALNQI